MEDAGAPARDFNARDRMLRQRSAAMTREQRLDEMQRLQAAAVALLRQSPAGYAHFLRRNFKARAIDIPPPPPTSGAPHDR